MYTKEALAIYNDIEQKLNTKGSKKVLTASSRNEPSGADKTDPAKNIFLHKNKRTTDGKPASKADYGIYSRHGYSIIEGVREENGYKYIEVRNPHFAEGSKYEQKKDASGNNISGKMKRVTRTIPSLGIVDEESGVVDYELNDFIKFFKRYDISEVRSKP